MANDDERLRLFDILLDIFDTFRHHMIMRTTEHSARELGSRSARQRLPIQARPYFTNVQSGLSLGYRRGKRGGTWIARSHDAEHGYRFQPLGKANDAAENVGLSYQQAQDKARTWMVQLVSNDIAGAVPVAYTVAQMMTDYLANRRKIKGDKVMYMRSIIDVHIVPALGAVELTKLKHAQVESWHHGLADAPPLVRSKAGTASRARTVDSETPDALRKRRATANRIFTVLRAALNLAYRKGKVNSKAAWSRIEPFGSVDAPKVRYLSVAECKRLIEACPDDFRCLVRAVLYTGCRYGELTRMKVSAFDPTTKQIHIADSKSGKPRFIALTDEGASFFTSVAQGKDDDAFMFTHDEGPREGCPWEDSQQRYWMELACEKAKIAPVISFHILRHTYASQLAMNNTPMPVIKELLGHADTRMTERHYAHLGESYVASTLRANLPSFGFESAI